MNWYTTLKLAYPYGRIKCPSCGKSFANDFGFKDVSEIGNQKGNTSTQELGGTPFVDFEEKQYEEPINGIHKDQIERGTITAECPRCHQWLEVEYEWNTAAPETTSHDYFSQVKVTDIVPITPEMAQAYKGVGMSGGFGIPEDEPDTDKIEDPTLQTATL